MGLKCQIIKINFILKHNYNQKKSTISCFYQLAMACVRGPSQESIQHVNIQCRFEKLTYQCNLQL